MAFFGTHEKPLGASFNKLLRLLLKDNLGVVPDLTFCFGWDFEPDYRYVMFPRRQDDMYSNSVGCICLQK